MIRDAILALQEVMATPDGEYATFTWKGASVRCVPNTLTRGSVVIVGGHEHVVSFSLNVLREYFITVDSTFIIVDSDLYTADNSGITPVAGKILTYNSKTYRILTAGLDPSKAFFRLDLADQHSGR